MLGPMVRVGDIALKRQMSQVFSLGSSLPFLIAFIFVLEQQETVLGAWPVHHYGDFFHHGELESLQH